MSELLGQLGVDPKLLLSQGVNFFIVLAALTFFVYKPLVKTLNERKSKIDLGLRGAEEVEKKLNEMEVLKLEKIKEGEKAAFETVRNAEENASKRGEEIVKTAEEKAALLLKTAQSIQEQKRIEALGQLSEESKILIKKALQKMVSLKPEAIDEALVEEAVGEIRRHRA